MSVEFTLDDLPPLPAHVDRKTAQDTIDDAMALAVFAAPCLESPDLPESKAKVAKAIIRQAIIRSFEAGTGALSSIQRSAGPFQRTDSFDTRTPRQSLFWKSEIAQLREICEGSKSGAFHIDTAPGTHRHGHHHRDHNQTQGHGILIEDYWTPGEDECWDCLL